MFVAPLVLLPFLAAGMADDSTPVLHLPDRPETAIGGTAFATKIAPLAPHAREERIFQEVMAGNVPSFLRKLAPVPIGEDKPGALAGATLKGTIYVTPDYLAVGSDDDYLYVPMTPYTAQRIADKLHCTLPTPKMVDAIYIAAAVKLTPSPIPPSPAMTTVPVFMTHTSTVIKMRKADPAPFSALTAGDKKDIVICRDLKDRPGRVAIYGWHQPDKQPIQPLYLGHIASWADYSHGVRLVADGMLVGTQPFRVQEILRDPKMCSLLSNEGPIDQPRYVFHHFPRNERWITTPVGERVEMFEPVPEVRAVVDTPTKLERRVEVVIYALPNGNTIEQTFGRKPDPDEDKAYDIQQIGAQTRFLRQRLPNVSLVVVYLEAKGHAWPAWMRAHKPADAKAIIDVVKARFPGRDTSVTLDSHSGGGALLFNYIQAVDQIPDWIDRIAFLDSEYDYDTASHEAKLSTWLKRAGHYLCAIAYDDSVVRLNGKPVVTPEGGTWGRSHAMLADLGKDFPIAEEGKADPERYVGLAGRVVFLLKPNPHKEILHTVQVERNGFIESLVSGTSIEGKDYQYFGPRAYASFIFE